MQTNVTQKYKILERLPHWGHKTIGVVAWNTETSSTERHVIPFSDLAAEFDPEGEGNVINVVIIVSGNDPESGPWSEPKEIPLTPHEFVKDLLDTVSDPVLTKEMRDAYMSQYDDALCAIIERRDAEC